MYCHVLLVTQMVKLVLIYAVILGLNFVNGNKACQTQKKIESHRANQISQ
jgi:hypothetical protein